MKKIALILALLMIMTFSFAGCETQHKIKFFVGDELVKEYRVDSNKFMSSFDPKISGAQLVSWKETDGTPYNFALGASKDVELQGNFYDALQGVETTNPTKFTSIDVDKNFEVFGEFGKVLSVAKSENGIYVVAEGYYGYHLDENPSMTVGVTISNDGIVKSVTLISTYNQSEGYVDLVSQDYLNSVYPDTPANTTNEVDPATGSTATSKAVRFAVWTASNYADKVFGIVANTGSKDNESLNLAYAGEYTRLKSTYIVDEKLGTVLYSATGISAKGEKLLGVIVKSAQTINYDGTEDTGWEASMPNSATIAIVFNSDTNKVVGINVITDGAKSPEYFAVPKTKLDAYKTVVVKAEDAFDSFKGGLVLSMNDAELSGDVPPITGTTIIYSGATQNGTFTSQIVRNAFSAAARFFVNNK